MSNTPITNLDTLLANMDPVLGPCCAFCQVDEATYKALPIIPIAMFKEKEGITVIAEKAAADSLKLPYKYTGVQITLNVNSALEAVGFLARITSALAASGISVNAFSPVSHDHLFVLPNDATRALAALKELSRSGVRR